MSFGGQEAALLFKIGADSSGAINEINRLENSVKRGVSNIVSAFPGGQFFSPFFNEITRGSKTAKKDLDEVAQGAGVAGVALGGLGVPALAAAAGVAVLTTGVIAAGKEIFELTKRSSEAGAEIYDLSQRVNFNATTLSGLKLLAEDSNVSFRTLSVGLGLFDKATEKAAENSKSTLGKAFKELNVDVRDNEKALRQTFEALYKLGPTNQQTALAMQFFGKSGKDVLEVIKESNGNLDAAIQKYGDLGLIIDTQAARKAKEFQRELTLVNQQIAGITREVGEEFTPAVKHSLESVSGFLKDNRDEFKAWGSEAADALDGIIAIFNGRFGPAVGNGVKTALDLIAPLLPVLRFIEHTLAEIG
jgi:hypothetical protein